MQIFLKTFLGSLGQATVEGGTAADAQTIQAIKK